VIVSAKPEQRKLLEMVNHMYDLGLDTYLEAYQMIYERTTA